MRSKRGEIAVTEFAPGVNWALAIGFIVFILSIPVAQFMISDEGYAKLSGKDPAAATSAEAPQGIQVTATVTAVSAPPDTKGVYNDFQCACT